MTNLEKMNKKQKFEMALNAVNEFKGINSLPGFKESEIKKEKKSKCKKEIKSIDKVDEENSVKEITEKTPDILVKKRKSHKEESKQNKKHKTLIDKVVEENSVKEITENTPETLVKKRKSHKEESKQNKKLKTLNESLDITVNNTDINENKDCLLSPESISKKIKVKGSKHAKSESAESEKEIQETIDDDSEMTTEEKSKIIKKNYILIENIDPSITTSDMKTYLKENNIAFDNVLVSPGSLGVASFERPKDMEKLFNICQGLQYKTNELFIFKSVIDKMDDGCVSNMCNTAVHLKNLDVSVTEEDIVSLIPHLTVKSVSINTDKKIAIIDFDDNESAKECIKMLDQKTIADKVICASYLVKSQRPDVFTIKVSNLPNDVNSNDIRDTFTTALKIKLLKKGTYQCLIHFKSGEDMNDVLNSETEFLIKGNKVTVEQLVARNVTKSEPKIQYVLNIFNLPFDTTIHEIKEQYPEVRYIEMLRNSEGNFVGSAKLMYNDKQYCEDALKYSKGMTFKHRKVRAEMKVEEGIWNNNSDKKIVNNNNMDSE